MQHLGDKRRTIATTAVKNQFCSLIRDPLLDVAFDNALAEVVGAGGVARAPLVVLNMSKSFTRVGLNPFSRFVVPSFADAALGMVD